MQIKILIVDDVKANLISLRAILEEIDENFLIIEANSGEEALEQVLNYQVDLVILDIQMPIMDGFEVAQFLKSNNLTKDIPILFLTAAFKSEEFVQKGFELGAVDYLTKPINKHKLINRINLYTKLFREMQENRQKDRLMFQQSKMAAMGDMLATIAHQWRQPLSAISSRSSGLSLMFSMGTASNEEIKEELDNINKITQYLSSTIDDFRTFFRTDKDKSKFKLSESIKKSLAIVEVLFEDSNINIITNLDDEIELYTYENEFLQVLLTLFTNAKDALDDKIHDRYIFITTEQNDGEFILKIKDNAGGVPLDIMDKIFEPYFTTKHQSQGTGIGLFICNEIIVKHMKGKIGVKNIDFKYDGHSYIGAEFSIRLPKQ